MNFTDYVFEFSSKLNKTSVIFKNELSYKETFKNVNKKAFFIKNKKLSNNDSVLLVSENSNFFIENYFGIIKSGAICVPINPTLNSKEIKYIIDSLNVKLIFVQNKFNKKIKQLISDDNVELYTEQSECDLIEVQENDHREDINIKEDVAVILFTSGSQEFLRV